MLPRDLRIAALLAMVLLVTACGSPAKAKRSPSPTPHVSASPTPVPTPTPMQPATQDSFTVTAFSSGLTVPWAAVELPDGSFIVSERYGPIVHVRAGGALDPTPLTKLSVHAAPGDESGVLGLALDPQYPSQPYLYVDYTGPDNNDHIARFMVTAGGPDGIQLGAPTNLLTVTEGNIATQCCHYGGRIAFGPDGDLYITTGDAYVPTNAMSLSNLDGKILRITPTGGIPSDNPFPNSPIWAYGLRNPQGIAWTSAGVMYASVNGPTGDLGLYHRDEIEVIQKGAFYGWPLYAANTRTSVADPGGLPPDTPPILSSGPDFSWAPSGIAWWAPSANVQPSLLVTELNGQALMQVIVNPANPSAVTGSYNVVTGHGRLRDVLPIANSNCVLLLTSNDDGRGSGAADQLLKACAG
ncbi:MAG TPA: PQQ-dependent sugar dehydrogenase [Candidatus Dormibacteraeota bacterium]|nr:PQQ-dependent sugar dehydrogenase [Candidatus Dormibacteraeota bacterium]